MFFNVHFLVYVEKHGKEYPYLEKKILLLVGPDRDKVG